VGASRGGVGAAELRQRRCTGCQLEINAAELREFAAAAEDEVLRCEECGRILIRTVNSGLHP
jgi:predicted  nucleic acid-binding Zn-ribbon protein